MFLTITFETYNCLVLKTKGLFAWKVLNFKSRHKYNKCGGINPNKSGECVGNVLDKK